MSTKTENLSLSNLGDMQVLAQDIKRFIEENKLSTNVQGKNFPQAEAWQYAGNRLNIIPQAGYIKNVSVEDEIKYEASIILLDITTGRQVGQGFAVCSNREQGKKYYQEYAIASMAQTRAIGKAFRIMLSFIMRLAGYEPTPAEELDYDTNSKPEKEAKPAKAPTPAKQENAPQAAASEPQQANVRYATPQQKEEIINLLNDSVITRQEKTKMLLGINTLDDKKAAEAITKIKKVIEDRKDGQSNAA